MNKKLNQKIQIIEQLITDTKASLKFWANLIGQYHIRLKEFTNQLATLKKQLNTDMKNNNSNNQGGTK